MLIIVCIIWLLSKAFYKEFQGSGFLLSFMFWAALALLDFFIQSVSYGILEMSDKPSDVLLRVSYDRGIYMIIMAVIAVLICNFLKNTLESGALTFIYSGIRGTVLCILLGVCIIYFQRIYKLIVSEQYVKNWGIFIMMSIMATFLAVVYIFLQDESDKNKIHQIKIEMLESNYQELVKQYQEKSTFLHDVKNHMNIIRELAETGEANKIIEYIEQNYVIFHNKDKIIWTNNQMLDLVLNMKYQEAAEEQIEMEVACDEMGNLCISSADLCSLFTNLLDNAIEANMRRVEGEEKWIYLSCKRHGNMLIIDIENPVSEMKATKNGVLKTLKSDKNWHGLGLSIIQKIVGRYEGYMEYEIRDKKFIMILFLIGFGNMKGGEIHDES